MADWAALFLRDVTGAGAGSAVTTAMPERRTTAKPHGSTSRERPTLPAPALG